MRATYIPSIRSMLIIGVVTLLCLFGAGVVIGMWLCGKTVEQTVKELPAYAKHDIAHDWCAQSREARDLCASWKIEPMDGGRK
jgi:hypothetical protein